MDIDPEPPQPTKPVAPPFLPPPTKSGRVRQFPSRYEDFLPNSRSQVPHLPAIPELPVEVAPLPSMSPTTPEPEEPELQHLQTEPDDFGLFRIYPIRPTVEPDANSNLDDVCDAPGLETFETPSDSETPSSGRWWARFGSTAMTTAKKINNIFAPFKNPTIFRLMNWYHSGSGELSVSRLNSLVRDVINHSDFQNEHLNNFSAKRELERLDDEEDTSYPFSNENVWRVSTVTISLPAEGVKHASENNAPVPEVSGVHHRSLVEAITTAFQDETAKKFHYTPHHLYWKPTPESQPERVVTDLFNSDAFIGEYKELLKRPPPSSGPHIEMAIAAMMLWSDSTHLAEFGTASLWPIYLFFGNQSKYSRARPSDFAAHHVAYIPSLPEDLQDTYMKEFDGLAASAITITHLKRELVQKVWELLLDDEFMEAYKHGTTITCADGVTRRIYPRIFTYSADYPEKVVLSTIRNLGKLPSPRTLIQKKYIPALGTTADDQRRQHIRLDDDHRQTNVETARKFIFEKGLGVKSAGVEGLLESKSYTPTRSAFSLRLSQFNFNFFSMFVPDLLHEFELGVWKAVFTHLIRILYAAGNNGIQKLNWRYRRVPTFGRGTIRRFCNNAASMKKLAARDFEDLLQCSIPVMELLLPEPHNTLILDLLFILCTWHASAKLRLHTATTLRYLKEATRSLGFILRKFVKKTCLSFDTHELPREVNARTRRKAATSAGKSGKGKEKATTGSKSAKTGKQKDSTTRLQKLFNLFTYKLSALGEYTWAIQQYGTTEGYSTQTGELEHRRVKRFYARTNKTKTFITQIAKHLRRERVLRKISQRAQATRIEANKKTGKPSPPTGSSGAGAGTSDDPQIQATRNIGQPSVPFEQSDPLPLTPPEVHHHISNTQKFYENIPRWLDLHDGDLALIEFLPKLKDHLLSRLLGRVSDGVRVNRTYTDDDRDTVEIVYNRLYKHKAMRVNYTTYDMRREQDTINPRTRPDIMLLSHEDSDELEGNPYHPYWYARVLGIFHVNVKHSGPSSRTPHVQKIELLYVRWFGRDFVHAAGWSARRLHRVGFLPPDSPGAFGFIDPFDIIRGVHMIPAFAHGKIGDPELVKSVAQRLADDEDWLYYYVGMFVDRDMFMRFRGGGVGHRATREHTKPMSQESDTTIPDENEDRDSESESLGDGEQLEEDESSSESDFGEGDRDEAEARKDVGDIEDEFDGEDGEEPWGIDEYTAEGYAPP